MSEVAALEVFYTATTMTLSELSYAQIEQALQALPEPLPHHSRSRSSSSNGSSSFLVAGSSHGGYHGYAAWQGGYQEHEAEIKQEKPAVLSALLQQSLLTLAMQPQRRAMAEQDLQANPAHSQRGTDLDLHDDDYSEPSSPHYGQEQEQQQQQHQQQQHFHFQQQHVQQPPQRELQWPEVACPMPLPTPSFEYSSKKRSLSSATHSSHSSFEGAVELPYAGQQQQSVKQVRAYSCDAATSRSVSSGRKVCTVAGCSSVARGSGLCKRHGGGKRCNALMCRNSARSGSDFCTSHGGGRRCTVESCKKGAEGSSFLCVTHGGGKRCNFEGCIKKDQGRGFCKAHGGGRRCQATGCDKTVKTGSELCGTHFGTYNLLGALIQRAGAN